MASEQDYTSPAEIRHRIGSTGSFRLNNVSGDIGIHAADGDDVVVVARWEHKSDEPLPLSVERGDGYLRIDLNDQAQSLLRRAFSTMSGVEFDVTLPINAQVDISAVSSDVVARGLLGEQSYKTVSGDINLAACGGRVSVTTVSGDVELAASQPLDTNITTTSGDAGAQTPRFDGLRFRTVSGDISLRGAFAVGPLHAVESVSGDLSIRATSGLTVDVNRGLDFSRSRGRRLVVGDGAAQLRFRSLSGDVDMESAHGYSPATTAGNQEPTEKVGQPPKADAPTAASDSLEVLRALERGEIDVEEASRRLQGVTSNG